MNVKYDRDVDALYIELAAGSADHSEEVKPGIVLDFDSDGKLLGIEVLDVKDVVAPGLTLAQAAE